MIKINLLPWRALQREDNKKKFIVITAILVFIVIMGVAGVNGAVIRWTKTQNIQNQSLQDKIKVLNESIEEMKALNVTSQEIVAKIKIVHDLQLRRGMTARLWDELIRILPADAFLTNIQCEKKSITFQGDAESHHSIAQLMRNLEISDLIQKSELVEVKKSTKDKALDAHEFTVRCALK